MLLDPVGHRVLEIRSVGDVAIDEEIGEPRVKQFQPRLRFGCIRFQVITVEVEILGSDPPSHFLRSLLVDPIVRAEALVAVDIVDRDDEEDNVVEERRFGFCDCDITQEHEARVFAVDLAGVDAVLNQKYRLVALRRLLRIEQFVF